MNFANITEGLVRHGVPNHMRSLLYEYIVFGVYPDDEFLLAVLRSDLLGAARYANDTDRHCLYNYAAFLISCAPMQCSKSKEAITLWCSHGGLVGKQPKHA
jgi:hypothetical protein